MSDLQGGDDFEASLRERFAAEPETTSEAAAEPEAASEPDETETPEPEAAAAERLRDESGRYTNEQKLLAEHGLTQFKSVGDALKSYRELQGLQGRQAQEIGEIRQQLQEFAATQQHQNQPPVSYDDYDPATATQIAWERGDSLATRRALEQWKDEDPFAAAVWYGNVQREQELANLRQEYDSRLAPVQRIQAQDEMTAAFQNVAARNPGIAEVDLLGAAQEAPDLLEVIQSGTQRERELAFENLYGRALRRQAELAEATDASRAAHTAETKAAKLAAAVATSASSRSAPTEGKDAIDRFKAGILGAETGLVDRFANQ